MDKEILRHLKKKRIIVFMPAYNEEKNIGNVIERIPDIVDKIIVVDDCSQDNTKKLAEKMGAIVIRHEKNSGSGAGYKTGFKTALKYNPDIVVLIHSDGQHDPGDIIKVVSPILKGEAEYILGGRIENMFKNMPVQRYIGNKVLSFMWSLATGYNLKDALTGFHAISGESLRKLNIDRWANDFLVETNMLEDVVLNNIKIKEMPVKCVHSENAVSVVKPFKDGPAYFFASFGAILRRVKKMMGFKVIIPDNSYRVWKTRKPSNF